MEHGMLNTGSQWSEREICAMIAEVKLPPGFGFASASFRIIQALMLAGFCLLFACTPALSEEIFKPTGRYAQPAKPTTQRQWYLVSEPWCSACPAAKARFKRLGWPDANVLTIAQCEARFGFRPNHVPFEFGEPVETESVSVVPQSTTMSHSEMVGIHNRLHGGGSWTWPGDLATHLQTVHGIDAAHPAASSPRIQQSACPGGNCPTPTNRAQRRGGFLRGLFR